MDRETSKRSNRSFPPNRKPGIALYPVPAEPLWDIFTPHVIGELQKARTSDSCIDFRLRVLRAGGLNGDFQNRELRAYKAAWETYLVAAFGYGLFEGPHGTDVRARLSGIDDDNFRSALSECFAAWYLAGKLKLRIKPRPKGQGDSNLEFAIRLDSGDIKVEVKAPYRPIVEGPWWGDDSDLLENSLRSANDQFDRNDRNLLIVVPRLRLPLFDIENRRPIERAFIGETMIQIPIDVKTGGPAGPERLVFKENGKFAKHWPPKSDAGVEWKPRFTRVGAALFLGEFENDGLVKHYALMVHNPHAAVPLPREVWTGIPEFLFESGRWRWSDEEKGT